MGGEGEIRDLGQNMREEGEGEKEREKERERERERERSQGKGHRQALINTASVLHRSGLQLAAGFLIHLLSQVRSPHLIEDAVQVPDVWEHLG